MRSAGRWVGAAAVSFALFALSWWLCQAEFGLDEAGAVGVAGAILAVTLAAMGWWASREPSSDGGRAAGGQPVAQKGHAGRDVNIAGRDQAVINYGRRDG